MRVTRITFLLCLVTFTPNCAGKKVGQAPAKQSAQLAPTSELEARMKQCDADLDNQKRLSAACAAEKAALQKAMDGLNAELQELKATPSAVSQEIVAAADAASTVAEIDAVLDRIRAFNDRFPAAPERATVARVSQNLKKRRVQLAKEEAKAKALASIATITDLLSGSSDGQELSVQQQIAVARYFVSQGMKYDAISALPRTTYAEAMKDPESERGKALVVSGTVIQISKVGDYFIGLICTEFCNKVYHFMTSGTTKGINQDSYVSFAGVVAQRYSYANSGGGFTHSIALVGYFRGQE